MTVPNPLQQMAATTTVSKAIRRATIMSRIGTPGAGFNMSADATGAGLEMVDQCNEALTDVLADFPKLNTGSSYAGTVAAYGTSATMPPTLNVADIEGIYLPDSDDPNHPLIPTTKSDVEAMPGDSLSTDSATARPTWYFVNDDGTIHFVPLPSASLNYTVVYRGAPALFTLADTTAAEGSGAIVPVPDKMIEVYTTKLAAKLAELSNSPESGLAQTLAAKYEAVKAKWINRLTTTGDRLRNDRFNYAGYPQTTARTTEFTLLPEIGDSF